MGDLAYYYGEGAPASDVRRATTDASPEPPAGYAYDYVNTEVLLTRMSVRDGGSCCPTA